MSDVNIFAETDYRGSRRQFGIRKPDRTLHMYVIGRTGMGKTSLLVNMALNDIHNGEGLCFLDPHGDAAEQMLDYIPEERLNDVVYINPGDTESPFPLNPLDRNENVANHQLVSGVLSIFKKLYAEHWQHRQEHILRNALYAILEAESNPTLIDVYRLLVDWRYRKQVTAELKDPVLKAFWQGEFTKYVYQYKGEALAPIQNKLGAFLTAPLIRNIIGSKRSGIDFGSAMDSGKVLLVNLSKGQLGEDNASFLGSLIVLKLYLAALGRINTPEDQRRDHYLYIDEFQSFVATEGLDGILSEARKYRLCLILAHQYLGQLDERLRESIFGNVGSTIAFPVGPENGHTLRIHFRPQFGAEDLVNQARYHIYLRLAINGVTSKPFSAETLPPMTRYSPSGSRELIIRQCRDRNSMFKENPESKADGSSGPSQRSLL